MTGMRNAPPVYTIVRCCIVGLGIVLLTSHGASAGPGVKAVDDAVDKGVAYLLSQQKADGSWETEPRLSKPETTQDFIPSKYAIYGGETAIATYALLAAGQSADSEPMKKAAAWLEKTELHGTYAIGLRSQVWNLLPDSARSKPFTFARDRDRDFIYYGRVTKGGYAGFYAYTYGADFGGTLKPGMPPIEQTGQPDKTSIDRSNSQYAVLGAWAVEQAGAEIPTKYWEEEDAAWKNAQQNDGSWTYNTVINPTMVYSVDSNNKVNVRAMTANDKIDNHEPTMTCAGVATLYITQDYLMRANGHMFDTCNGGVSNPNIDRGLAWLDKHITSVLNYPLTHYAYYGVERIGVASGRKYIGGVDWFDHGSQLLVQTQENDGSWHKTLHDTAFSVLFLIRGRAPVMMNKLIYTNSGQHQTDPWNERPRDAANLAKWMGKRSLEGFLNWQLVDLKYPVEEFHDAPILYISGSEPITLSEADCDKLRLFVQQGGMILGNADCGKKTFTTAFKKLGSKLFPTYEFRQLPPSHPIFTEQYLATKWKSKPQVWGLSNSVRELMILIPDADSGRAWQTDSYKTREELFQLGGNIFLYATGKANLRHKGDSYIVRNTIEGGRTIAIARLMVGENPDPEPGGWPQLNAILLKEKNARLETANVKLGGGDLAKYKIAHLTGTTKLILHDDQRKELKSFVEDGGTLIIDSAGGSVVFADSAEAELKAMFGEAATTGLAAPLPKTHALFATMTWQPKDILYRAYARQKIVGNQTEPRLRGIATAAGRIGVFFSREDISAGLVGEAVDGIVGYEPRVSAQLMQSMILYAGTP